MPDTRTVDALLESYSREVRTIAEAARRHLHRVLPGIEERAEASAPVIAYGYWPGYRGLVCTLIFSKSEVKLGLVRAGGLADPKRLLLGRGKVHRHIRLRTAADLRRAGVDDLIAQTLAAWRQRAES
jgi:hypothetical protein